MSQTAIRSEVLMQQLKSLIEIPDNVQRLVLTLEVGELAVVSFQCLATEQQSIEQKAIRQ
jgi:hypothetical protein